MRSHLYLRYNNDLHRSLVLVSSIPLPTFIRSKGSDSQNSNSRAEIKQSVIVARSRIEERGERLQHGKRRIRVPHSTRAMVYKEELIYRRSWRTNSGLATYNRLRPAQTPRGERNILRSARLQCLVGLSISVKQNPILTNFKWLPSREPVYWYN